MILPLQYAFAQRQALSLRFDLFLMSLVNIKRLFVLHGECVDEPRPSSISVRT